jgi:hypothetical protein
MKHRIDGYLFITSLSTPSLPSKLIGASAFISSSIKYNSYKHHLSNNQMTSKKAMWDPITQTYANSELPSRHNLEIDELLRLNGGKLKIFGYGSLCWHPGREGVLSLAVIDADEDDEAAASSATYKDDERKERKVTTAPGRAIGYQRCWCQRSADHRGTPEFNGIVCTLLSDEEVNDLHRGEKGRTSMTEGMIYTVDEELVEDCLAELDFREKGVSAI